MAWDDVGQLQFDYIKKLGLKPHHKFLDLPCGSLRLGRFLVDYLKAGHYYGAEGNPELIEAAKTHVLTPTQLGNVELHHTLLSEKPRDFQKLFQTHFDFIWIHALFDHIPHAIIAQFLKDIVHVMDDTSQLYTTIFLNPHGESFKEPLVRPRYKGLKDAVVTFPDREYWHHTLEFFETTLKEIPLLQFEECLYDYPHPPGLRVLKFSKKSLKN